MGNESAPIGGAQAREGQSWPALFCPGWLAICPLAFRPPPGGQADTVALGGRLSGTRAHAID